MTNIQDDQSSNTTTVLADKQTDSPTKPSKADVDELLDQLEALNQEIAAKTVVDKPQLEEKKDQVEKLETPLASPALEESDKLQLPTAKQTPELPSTKQTPELPTVEQRPQLSVAEQVTHLPATDQPRDMDLDRFIDELEAKIVKNKEEKGEQEKAEVEPVKIEEEIKPPTEEEPKEIGEEEPIGEDFGRKRPSLDLSEISEESIDEEDIGDEKPPALTLDGGRLKEDDVDSPTDLPPVSANIPPASPSFSTEPTLSTEPAISPEPAIDSESAISPEPAIDSESAISPEPSINPEPSRPDLEQNEPSDSEDLESQNIFSMLGLETLAETEKEAFLNDLEKLIWDNFIELDLPLLLNTEEQTQVDQILADVSQEENDRKEALLVYLENIVPDLEEKMYKKAINLKREMFEERVANMRKEATEKNNLSLIADLDQIQDLIQAGRYQTAVNLLNKA